MCLSCRPPTSRVGLLRLLETVRPPRPRTVSHTPLGGGPVSQAVWYGHGGGGGCGARLSCGVRWRNGRRSCGRCQCVPRLSSVVLGAHAAALTARRRCSHVKVQQRPRGRRVQPDLQAGDCWRRRRRQVGHHHPVYTGETGTRPSPDHGPALCRQPICAPRPPVPVPCGPGDSARPDLASLRHSAGRRRRGDSQRCMEALPVPSAAAAAGVGCVRTRPFTKTAQLGPVNTPLQGRQAGARPTGLAASSWRAPPPLRRGRSLVHALRIGITTNSALSSGSVSSVQCS